MKLAVLIFTVIAISLLFFARSEKVDTTVEKTAPAVQVEVPSLPAMEFPEEKTPSPTLSVEEPLPAKPTQSKTQWRANYNAAQVERHLALSGSEREELISAFLSGKNLTNLAEIIGEERARLFEQGRERALAEAEDEEIADTLFKLSRRLRLSQSEEQEVEQAIRGTRAALKPKYNVIRTQSDEAMALHDSSPDDGQRLRQLYDTLKRGIAEAKESEKRLMLEQLQGVLPDEKLNALIEELAK